MCYALNALDSLRAAHAGTARPLISAPTFTSVATAKLPDIIPPRDVYVSHIGSVVPLELVDNSHIRMHYGYDWLNTYMYWSTTDFQFSNVFTLSFEARVRLYVYMYTPCCTGQCMHPGIHS